MMNPKTLKSMIFNITIACFEVPLIPLYDDVDGKIEFAIKDYNDLYSRYAKFTRTRIELKVAKKGQWGTWKKGVGYIDGVLGMLQNKEADKTIFKVAIHTQDPPGIFTSPMLVSTYHLASRYADDKIVSKDLLSNVFFVEPICWLSYFVLLLIINCISFMVRDGLDVEFAGLLSRALNIIFRVVQSIFKQDSTKIKVRSLFILSGLMVTLYTAIYGATYNTNTIVGASIDRVETLLDIIKLNKVPIFIEGESMHELFESETGPEFSAVYRHAKKLKSEKSLPLDIAHLVESFKSGKACYDHVVLVSNNLIQIARKAAEVFCALTTGANKFPSFVSKPYHQTIRMEIINPRVDGPAAQELVKRDTAFANRYFEGGLATQLSANLNDYTYHTVVDLISSVSLMYDNAKPQPNQPMELKHINALKLSNFTNLFRVMVLFYFIATVINIFLFIWNYIVS